MDKRWESQEVSSLLQLPGKGTHPADLPQQEDLSGVLGKTSLTTSSPQASSWAVESVPGEGSAPPEEQQAMDHFRDTVVRDEDGRYSVQLPRKSPAPQLGESRKIAEKRFLQNERALTRKGTWDAFNAAVKEYPDLGHAEEVPTASHQGNVITSPCMEWSKTPPLPPS